MAISVTKDQAGVDALKRFGADLLQSLDDMHGAITELQRTYDGVRQTIAHESDMDELVDGILELNAKASTSAAELNSRLIRLANKLDEFLNEGKP